MKIGIFTNNYLPNPYGVTGSIESFRKELESLGHEVFIFAPKRKGYNDENKKVFRYPALDITLKFKFPLAIPYSHEMNKIISELDLDIIHSQHPNLLGSCAKKWAQRKKIPLVFTWHTLYDQYTHFFPILPKKWTAKWIISQAVKYANSCEQVIAPSDSAKKIIQKWGVKKDIQAISTGVDESIFAGASRNIFRDKYKVKENEVLLLLISRLTEEKNIDFLFEAITEVVVEKAEVKFLVAGGGYLLEKLQEKTKELGLEGKIFFSGEVKKEEVKNYYAAGDIFVYASKSETQGMIISEAMYLGLPVVAVEATGVKDAVENNVSGYLVSENKKEFQEAVEKLIVDENLRHNFSENGKRIAREKYTAKVCTQKLLAIYQKAITDYKKSE